MDALLESCTCLETDSLQLLPAVLLAKSAARLLGNEVLGRTAVSLRGFSSSLGGGCLLIQQHLAEQAQCIPKSSDLLEAGCQNRQFQAPGPTAMIQ